MIYLYIFLISMLPIVELRGSIIFSYTLANINIPLAIIISIIGNLLVMPIIFIFAKKILLLGLKFKYTNKICSFFLNKGHSAGQKLLKKSDFGVYFALFLFVGIPLPATGVWTGTLAASLLDLDFKKCLLSIIFGIFLASFIMVLALSVFKFIL